MPKLVLMKIMSRALRYLRYLYSYSSYEHDLVMEQIFENKNNIKNLSQVNSS